jgi:hypothetical protein
MLAGTAARPGSATENPRTLPISLTGISRAAALFGIRKITESASREYAASAGRAAGRPACPGSLNRLPSGGPSHHREGSAYSMQ